MHFYDYVIEYHRNTFNLLPDPLKPDKVKNSFTSSEPLPLSGGNLLFLCREKEHTLEGGGGLLINRYCDPIIDLLPAEFSFVKIDVSSTLQCTEDYFFKPHFYSLEEFSDEVSDLEFINNSLDDLQKLFADYGLAGDFDRSSLTKHLHKVAGQVEFYKKIFHKHNAKAIFVRCYYCMDWHAALIAAAVLDIPVIDIQHGRTGPFHPGYTHWGQLSESATRLIPDRFLLWSEQWANCIRTSEIDRLENRLFVTGDLWRNFAKARLRVDDQIKKLQEVRSKYKTVVLISLQQYRYTQLPDYVFDCLCDETDGMFCLVRLHPRTNHSETLVKKFQKVKANISLASSMPVSILFEFVDVHVTYNSTVAYEAAESGVPTVFTCPDSGVFGDLVEQGVALQCKSASEFSGRITQAVSMRKNIPSNDQDNRQDLMKLFACS